MKDPLLATAGEALPNVEFSGTNPFKKVRERLLVVERFVRDWGELEERMSAVYWNEIEHAASVDLFTKCTPTDGPATETAAWKSVLAEIDEYGATGRIVRLSYKESTVEAREDAVAACSALNTSTITYRLPTMDEARLLSPVVGFGPINWSGAQSNDIWFTHSNPTQLCAAGMNPFFRNLSSASADQIMCTAADGVVLEGSNLKIVCVPSGGPLPLGKAP